MKIFCKLNKFAAILGFMLVFYSLPLKAQNAAFNENHPLYFGNPSQACADKQNSYDNYLMEKPQYVLSYNKSALIPNWVAWHLQSTDIGSIKRVNDFRADDSLPTGWYKVKKSDYKFTMYGFDRGHVCPSADRTSNTQNNSATFFMTNMVPQSPDCNRIVWMHLETFERKLAFAGNEVYIFAGVYGRGGTGSRGYFTEIPAALNLAIVVPQYEWKILLVLPESGNDFERLCSLVRQKDESVKVYAFFIPNEQGCQNIPTADKSAKDENGFEGENDFLYYKCSVDYIEEKTGYDFFSLLPQDVQDELEK